MIAVIAAIDKNRGIGLKGKLLTHVPGDLPRFKKMTSGNSVVMGRKTYDSLPSGPLKERENIVITRSKTLEIKGALVVNSLEEALSRATKPKIFIIGGGEIYRQAMAVADTLYITLIEKEFVADTFFPEIDNSWKVESEQKISTDEDLHFSYITYVKRSA